MSFLSVPYGSFSIRSNFIFSLFLFWCRHKENKIRATFRERRIRQDWNKMPKKLATNSKAVEARERKAAVQQAEKVKKEKQKEDELWRDDDPKLAKKKQQKVNKMANVVCSIICETSYPSYCRKKKNANALNWQKRKPRRRHCWKRK